MDPEREYIEKIRVVEDNLAEGKKHATPSHAHEQRVDALLLLDGTVADFRVVNLAVKLVLFGLMLSVVLA